MRTSPSVRQAHSTDSDHPQSPQTRRAATRSPARASAAPGKAAARPVDLRRSENAADATMLGMIARRLRARVLVRVALLLVAGGLLYLVLATVASLSGTAAAAARRGRSAPTLPSAVFIAANFYNSEAVRAAWRPPTPMPVCMAINVVMRLQGGAAFVRVVLCHGQILPNFRVQLMRLIDGWLKRDHVFVSVFENGEHAARPWSEQ